MNDSEPLELPLKRCRPSVLQRSFTKKGRISETIIADFAETGKQVIGKPLLFQDGVGINWGRFPIQRSISEPTPNFSRAENDASVIKMGHSSSNPIVINDELHSEIAQKNYAESASPNRSESFPSQLGKTKMINEATSDSDNSHSNKSDHGEMSVPQVMEEELLEGAEAGHHTNIVVIKNLPSYIDSGDVTRLLNDSGFTLAVVEIIRFQHGMASLKFAHAHIADAAFSVIRHKTSPFPWRSQLGPLNISRWVPGGAGGLPTPDNSNNLEPPNSSELGGGAAGKDTLTDIPSAIRNSGLPCEILRDDETNADILNISVYLNSKTAGSRSSNSTGTLTEALTEEEASDSGSSISLDTDSENSTKCPPTPKIPPRKKTTRKIRHPPHSLLLDRETHQSLEQPQGSASQTLGYNPVFTSRDHPQLASSRGSSLQPFMQTFSAQRIGSNPCRLPDTPFNRPRRVLIPSNSSLPLVTVSMRADIQFIGRETRQRISSYSLPSRHNNTRRVNDACSIGNTIVVAYELGPCQISLISLTKGETPQLKDIGHKAHTEPQNNVASSKKDFLWVSCLAPAKNTNSTVSFITGGHDKSVKLWGIGADGRTTSETIARIGGSAPLALGPRDDSVLIGAGKDIFTVDMNKRTATPPQVKVSNIIHQIHIHPNAPSITILEVDHLDTQIQIFDNRRAGFNRPPDCAFGYRSEGKASTRYNRGSTYLSYFVRGYEDGCICIWDYRNIKHPVIEVKKDHLVQPVFHTVITSSEIVCYGVDGLAFRNHRGKLL